MTKKLLVLLICVFLLLLFSSLSSAEGPKLEFEARLWKAELVAMAKVSSSTSEGNELDFKNDLGIADRDIIDGKITWHIASKSKLKFSYTQMAFNGDKTVSRNLRFGEETFSSNSRIITDFDVKLLKIAWIYQFIDEKYFKIGPLFELKGIWIDTSLYTPSTETKQSDNLTTGIPALGAAVNITPFKFIDLFGEASGLYLDEERYGYTYDVEAGVRITPFEHISITSGYRVIELNAEDVPDYAKFKLEGPFFGALLRF